MRLGPGLLALTVVLALTGCGDSKEFPRRATAAGPLGRGASGVWLYRPAGRPKDLVVYFHGQGGPTEATPENHLPWINHLVARGSIVVYPRYEMTYEADPMRYIVEGVSTATNRIETDDLPVLAIGYSRGGAIAVEYAAVASRFGLPVPDSIISVFPASHGNQQREIDLTPLPHSTTVLIMIGRQDSVVGGTGARYLLRRLEQAGYPGENIELDFVSSHGAFEATHSAPLDTTPAAQAAFWKPADELLDELDGH